MQLRGTRTATQKNTAWEEFIGGFGIFRNCKWGKKEITCIIIIIIIMKYHGVDPAAECTVGLKPA